MFWSYKEDLFRCCVQGHRAVTGEWEERWLRLVWTSEELLGPVKIFKWCPNWWPWSQTENWAKFFRSEWGHWLWKVHVQVIRVCVGNTDIPNPKSWAVWQLSMLGKPTMSYYIWKQRANLHVRNHKAWLGLIAEQQSLLRVTLGVMWNLKHMDKKKHLQVRVFKPGHYKEGWRQCGARPLLQSLE